MDKAIGIVTKVLNESWDFLRSVPTFALKTWEEKTHGGFMPLFIITIVLLFLISYFISVFIKYKGD